MSGGGSSSSLNETLLGEKGGVTPPVARKAPPPGVRAGAKGRVSVVSTALFVAVALGALAYGVDRVVLPDVFPKRFAPVLEGKVYRSGELSPAAMERVVRRHGIRTVIDLGVAPAGDIRDRRLQLTAQALGVTRFRFDLEGDATGNPNAYVQALRLALDPARQPVLVHCAAGAQRTSCAIALLRMHTQGVSMEDALREADGFDAKPKVGEVLASIAPAVLRALAEGGDIPAGPDAPPDAQPLGEPRPTEPLRARP